MKVIVKTTCGKARFEEIENDLKVLQEKVCGRIETHTLCNDLVIICNAEGRTRRMGFNCRLFGLDFYGPVIIAGVKGENFSDIPLEEDKAREIFGSGMF